MLVAMATGTGKAFTAIGLIYRPMKQLGLPKELDNISEMGYPEFERMKLSGGYWADGHSHP